MLSSQVVRAIQLASLGVGCANGAEAAAQPGNKVAEVRPTDPPVEMSAQVREKMAVAARFDAEATARRGAIRRLGQMQDRTAVIPLATLLESIPEGQLRTEILRALEKLEANHVLAKAASDKRPEVRSQAINLLRVLCDREDEESATAMKLGLEDPDPRVRKSAATALGWCGRGDDVPLLVGRLSDDNDEVRSAVAQALGNFQDARAISALETAAKQEGDEFVQVFIRGALKRLKSR